MIIGEADKFRDVRKGSWRMQRWSFSCDRVGSIAKDWCLACSFPTTCTRSGSVQCAWARYSWCTLPLMPWLVAQRKTVSFFHTLSAKARIRPTFLCWQIALWSEPHNFVGYFCRVPEWCFTAFRAEFTLPRKSRCLWVTFCVTFVPTGWQRIWLCCQWPPESVARFLCLDPDDQLQGNNFFGQCRIWLTRRQVDFW